MATDTENLCPEAAAHGGPDASLVVLEAIRALGKVRRVPADPEVPANTVRANLWLLASLRTEVEAAVEVEVSNCRMFNLPWSEIGDLLNVTTQAAHKRYAHRMVDPAERVC